MKKIVALVVVLIVAIDLLAIWKFPRNKQLPTPKKQCTANNACYKVSMPNEPDLLLNEWEHYGKSNCISFHSQPDNDFHGYCGIYKIEKI